MTRPLQLEIPTCIRPEDTYSFPYWNEAFRVVGQPIHQLHLKYKSTYSRVANMMLKHGFENYSHLTVFGLLATNHRTIPHYIQHIFTSNGFQKPVIEKIGVVESDHSVVKKIQQLEASIKSKEGELSIFNGKLEHTTWIPGKPGRPPSSQKNILQFQKKFVQSCNFIDLDFMQNWDRPDTVKTVVKTIKAFAARCAVVHINAISNYPRTPQFMISEEKVREKVNLICSLLTPDFAIQAVEEICSYQTLMRAPTKMSSTVLALTRR